MKDTFDIPISSLISDFEMVRLENTDEALATNDHISLSENHIGHYNPLQEQSKLYDKTGKFLANLGQKGQGPNDYFFVYSSYIDEDEKKFIFCHILGTKF